MPFQSEKQRRYLWANEPEIARDWTDTYGSRIEKNDGGIMRTGFFTAGLAAGDNISPGTTTGSKARDRSQKDDMTIRDYRQPPGSHHKDIHGPVDKVVIEKKTKTERDEHREKIKQRAKIQGIKPKGHWTQKLGYDILPNDPKLAYDFLNTLKEDDKDTWESLPQELKNLIEGPPSLTAPGGKLDFDEWSMMTQLPGYGEFLSERGKPGVLHGGNVGHLGTRYVKYTGELDAQGNKIKATDKYGNTLYGYHDKAGGEGPIYYPGYVPGGSPVSGGGGTTATEVVEDTPSGFQESLTTSTSSPFDYYVGQDPTAANLAWGQKFGVDPRTMYRTSWAADGGRIGRAYGGIMDSSTGRRAYGLGSIFKSIKKAASKVLKSPVGKAVLLGGLGMYGANAGWFGATNPFFGKTGHLAPFLRQKTKEGFGKYSLAKLGILGAGALPFFMGQPDEDEDEGFDYDAAKQLYADELMRIKRGALAGSLDPNKFNYLGVKDGGRIGYYAGGQSTPSDYTMEDALMTTTQDKLGGITDVMKHADLYRQGSVGQFYAADGGRIGADEGGLMDMGGMEKDYRNDGGFVPIGGEEKADDVPARLSRNEFVFTADAVRGAGGGDIDAGAEIMENVMKNLEQGGQVSDETQGLAGAQEMFDVSERLSEVV